MTPEGIRAYMKAFFEKYYAQQRAKNPRFVEGVGIPAAMLDDGADPAQEWNIWKLAPVAESEYNIPEIEKKLHVTLPECIKAFFTTYHHRFEYPLGRNEIGSPFFSLGQVSNHHLIQAGYLPFAWRDDYFMLCMDLQNMPIEETCLVTVIDSERLWNLTDDWILEYRRQHPVDDAEPVMPRSEFAPLMIPVADSFYAFLEGVMNETIKPGC